MKLKLISLELSGTKAKDMRWATIKYEQKKMFRESVLIERDVVYNQAGEIPFILFCDTGKNIPTLDFSIAVKSELIRKLNEN